MNINRSEILILRVTPAEREVVDRLARGSQLSRSAVVRELLFGAVKNANARPGVSPGQHLTQLELAGGNN